MSIVKILDILESNCMVLIQEAKSITPDPTKTISCNSTDVESFGISVCAVAIDDPINRTADKNNFVTFFII